MTCDIIIGNIAQQTTQYLPSTPLEEQVPPTIDLSGIPDSTLGNIVIHVLPVTTLCSGSLYR